MPLTEVRVLSIKRAFDMAVTKPMGSGITLSLCSASGANRRDDPVWFGDKFNYKHTFNLKTDEYHFENYFGTITDFRVNWDDDNNAYAFVYQQFMSQPDHPNWIAGFPSDTINTSLWFYESYKPDYDLIESGPVEITDAKISFSTANPVPEPTTIALLGSGIIGLMISRKKFRTKRR